MRSEPAIGESGRWDTVAALALCAGIFVAWTFERIAPGWTPVDRALPLIAAALSLAAWAARDTRWFAAIECSIPLLIGWSMLIEDEKLRLIGLGVIAACGFCASMLASDLTAPRTAAIVLAGMTLIRWIARDRIEVGRELALAIGCILVALAFRNRTWGTAVALAAALVIPAIPVRTVAIPFVIAFVVWFAGVILGGSERMSTFLKALDPVPLLAIAAILFLFPWSGVAARALPFFWRAAPPAERVVLNYALASGEFVDIDLPPKSKALIVSAANALRMKRNLVVGRINGDPVIRIGRIADWGYARREQYWKSTDVLPRVPAGRIRGYGYDAWIDGAGRLPLPPGRHRIRVNAEGGLPRDFRLQVEAIEVEQRP